jgi:hypothetical protein
VASSIPRCSGREEDVAAECFQQRRVPWGSVRMPLSVAFCDFRGDALQSADYCTQSYNSNRLGSSGLNTPIKATLVSDIECFRNEPGAYELSARDHNMLLAHAVADMLNASASFVQSSRIEPPPR